MWMQDRFDEGRRAMDRTVHDGRKVFDRTVNDGRKAFDRTVHDGRRVVNDRFDDGRRALADRFGQGRRAVDDGVSLSAALWPAVVLAAGAGAAVWWWAQYSKGRAHSAATAHAEGGPGPRIPEPELVMAHNAAPRPQGRPAVDPSDADLVEPAEDLLMHAPVDEAPGRTARTVIPKHAAEEPGADAKTLAAMAARTSEPAGLESSLAVQGDPAAAKVSKRKGPNGASAGAAKPRRKGPTVM